MYGASLHDRPRTDSSVGHARRALDDLLIHGRLVKGGPPTRSKIEDDMQRLRSKWPRHALARIRRESLQQSITDKSQISMLNSQLAQVRAQMPAWGGQAHHVAHREDILAALRALGAQNVAADSSAPPPAPAAAEPAAASSSAADSAAAADPDYVAPAPKPKPRAKPKPKPRMRTNIILRS